MKANELRIGNYVNCPKDGQNPFRIDLLDFVSCGIGKFGMIYDKSVHPLTWYLQDLQPIPLTEEWLLKFGFGKEKVNDLYDNAFIKYDVLSSDLYLRPSYMGGYYWGFNVPGKLDNELYDAKNIKYVHQLQNLYFALTENELEIKE
jgi:hypothetical protein